MSFVSIYLYFLLSSGDRDRKLPMVTSDLFLRFISQRSIWQRLSENFLSDVSAVSGEVGIKTGLEIRYSEASEGVVQKEVEGQDDEQPPEELLKGMMVNLRAIRAILEESRI
jgi:hypothetical protein